MKNFKQTGLTLIEIMVTLAIVAILASIAAPNVKTMMENNQIKAITNDFAASLYLARSEAAKTGYSVTLCASNTGQTNCETNATTYANGWIVFRDYDGNRQLTASSTLFDPNNTGTKNTPESIVYTSNTPQTNLILQNSAPNSSSTPLARLTYAPTGQARVGDTTTNVFDIILRKAPASGTLGAETARLSVGMTGRVQSCFVSQQKSGSCAQ